MGLNRELDGLLVVSIEQAVAAPYCGLLLADAGARVIKVEREEGDFARGYDKGIDGNSVFFAWLNRGKQSVCLDLNAVDDTALLHRMLAKADIFVHNLAPGALDKRGFGADHLHNHNPGLITCEITGYGAAGQAADKKAYDFLVQAESGLCAVTGTPESPARVGISITDISTGLTAFSAILRALIQRGRTGKGTHLSIAMFDVLADWMNMPLLGHRYLGGAPARLGLTHALITPYGAYTTKDGSQILIAIQNNREWAVFCDRILGKPEIASDPRYCDNPERVANRAAINALINEAFAKKTRDQLIKDMNAARIACAQLSTVEDLSNHAFLREAGIRFGSAELAIADLPVQIDGERAVEVPLLNQHGAAIRQEFSD